MLGEMLKKRKQSAPQGGQAPEVEVEVKPQPAQPGQSFSDVADAYNAQNAGEVVQMAVGENVMSDPAKIINYVDTVLKPKMQQQQQGAGA